MHGIIGMTKRAGRKRDAFAPRHPNGKIRYERPGEHLNGTFYGEKIAIYVICVEDHAVKIGISNTPGNRVVAIQTGQDRLVTVYWAIRASEEEARSVEQAIHKRLRGSNLHLRGEWYLMSPAQAVAEIEREIAKQKVKTMVDLSYGWPIDGLGVPK